VELGRRSEVLEVRHWHRRRDRVLVLSTVGVRIRGRYGRLSSPLPWRRLFCEVWPWCGAVRSVVIVSGFRREDPFQLLSQRLALLFGPLTRPVPRRHTDRIPNTMAIQRRKPSRDGDACSRELERGEPSLLSSAPVPVDRKSLDAEGRALSHGITQRWLVIIQ
jgi:hypothetical protein